MMVTDDSVYLDVLDRLNQKFEKMGTIGICFRWDDENGGILTCSKNRKCDNKTMNYQDFETICMGTAFRVSVEVCVQEIFPDASVMWDTLSPLFFLRYVNTIKRRKTA